MNIFVGNLPFTAKEGDLRKLFSGFGEISACEIVMTKDKKRPLSRGFGFVVMPDEESAIQAIDTLNGKLFMGRPLKINSARSQEGAPAKKMPQAKPGVYKRGRRTLSYMKKRGLTEIPQDKRREFKRRRR